MLSLDAAIALLDERVEPLSARPVELPRAAGRRLAEPVGAEIDLPRADVSVMDGYAVRAADAGDAALPVAFEVAAGAAPTALPPGSAARIFTGAELPAGADAVVPQERAEVDGDGRVRLPRCEAGAFVRSAGEVCRVGDGLAEAGARMTPQLLSLLAAAGPSEMRVFPRPRLAIVTTGAELVSTSKRPGPGQIRDSNAVMLAALATKAGVETELFERVADDLASLRRAMSAAMELADLVVTSGGVSVGDYDLIPRVVVEMGGEIVFHKLAIKPGRPTLAAKVGAKWLIGLPGNPLSSLVGWHLMVRPVIERLAGDTCVAHALNTGEFAAAVENRGDRLVVAGATVEEGTGVARLRVHPWKGSHDVFVAAGIEALVPIAIGAKFAAGDQVEYLRIS